MTIFIRGDNLADEEMHTFIPQPELLSPMHAFQPSDDFHHQREPTAVLSAVPYSLPALNNANAAARPNQASLPDIDVTGPPSLILPESYANIMRNQNHSIMDSGNSHQHVVQEQVHTYAPSPQQQQQEQELHNHQHSHTFSWDMPPQHNRPESPIQREFEPQSPPIVAHEKPKVAPHTPLFSNMTIESNPSRSADLRTLFAVNYHHNPVEPILPHSLSPDLNLESALRPLIPKATTPTSELSSQSKEAKKSNHHLSAVPKSKGVKKSRKEGGKCVKKDKERKKRKPKLDIPIGMDIEYVRANAERERDQSILRFERLVGKPNEEDVKNACSGITDRAWDTTEHQKKEMRSRRRNKLHLQPDTPQTIHPKDASRLEAALSRYRKDVLIQSLLVEIKVLVRDKHVMKRYINKHCPEIQDEASCADDDGS